MGCIIDLSHHQDPRNIDYDSLAKQADLVIIRTQYGSSLIDRAYKTHHAEFKKRGVPTAAYAWVRGVSVSDMEKEATDFYNRTKDLHPTFWFLDVEERSMNDMRSGVSAYVKQLRKLGAKKIGGYIANNLYSSFNLKVEEFDAVWIPSYGSNQGTVASSNKPDHPCDIWQFTSQGRLQGYSGYLDLSVIISNKTLDFFTGKKEQQKPTDERIDHVVSQLFKDVSENHWAYKVIEDMKERNIMGGYPDGTFKPEAPITRAEVAAAIDKLLVYLSNKLK